MPLAPGSGSDPAWSLVNAVTGAVKTLDAVSKDAGSKYSGSKFSGPKFSGPDPSGPKGQTADKNNLPANLRSDFALVRDRKKLQEAQPVIVPALTRFDRQVEAGLRGINVLGAAALAAAVVFSLSIFFLKRMRRT